jgi:hypothetical protein
MDLSSSARHILRDVFGYESFRGAQQDIVEHVAAGGDALVLMPTGGGKSLCYQIPALLREGVAVVVSPLIALMQDQVATLSQLGVPAAFLNSTLDAATARDVVQRAVRPDEKLRAVRRELVHEYLDLAPVAVAGDEPHALREMPRLHAVVVVPPAGDRPLRLRPRLPSTEGDVRATLEDQRERERLPYGPDLLAGQLRGSKAAQLDPQRHPWRVGPSDLRVDVVQPVVVQRRVE